MVNLYSLLYMTVDLSSSSSRVVVDQHTRPQVDAGLLGSMDLWTTKIKTEGLLLTIITLLYLWRFE